MLQGSFDCVKLARIRAKLYFAQDDKVVGEEFLSLRQNGLRSTTYSSRIKNCAAQLPEPQITSNNPAICLRVISPRVPQVGEESTGQDRSSLSPTFPAFF